MASYGALWTARWRLLRPGNAAMAGVGVVVGGMLVVGTAPAGLLAAALAGFFITAAGNVLNDILDVEVDRDAHPDRPLPAGHITTRQAAGLAVALLVFGLWEAYLAAGARTLLFATVNSAVLVLYETRAKGAGLVGNVLVALLVASTFLFGAITVDAHWRAWGLVWALAAMAFLTNVARELMKDIQDLEGDLERRTTFPMRAGRPTTLLLAFFLVQAAVALSLLAWWQAGGVMWGILLLLAGVLFITASSMAWLDVRIGQQGLKLAMLLALVAFFVQSL